MKQYPILCIDTSLSGEVKVALYIDNKKAVRVQKKQRNSSEEILPLIEALLQKEHMGLTDIKEIEVNTGPGSYTGLRVGAAVGITLGMLLSVPVNGRIGRQLPDLKYASDKWEA